jgi:hypothetical protein
VKIKVENKCPSKEESVKNVFSYYSRNVQMLGTKIMFNFSSYHFNLQLALYVMYLHFKSKIMTSNIICINSS